MPVSKIVDGQSMGSSKKQCFLFYVGCFFFGGGQGLKTFGMFFSADRLQKSFGSLLDAAHSSWTLDGCWML